MDFQLEKKELGVDKVEQFAAIHHWEYFLALEDDMLRATRYVQFTTDQLPVHSQFFTQMLATAAAEFECVCKTIADQVGIESVGNIGQIKEMLIPILPSLSSCWLRLLRGELRVRPFADWENDSKPLCWWSSYNDLKHLRHRNLEIGSMQNAIYALGGLYLANLILANTIGAHKQLLTNQLIAVESMDGDMHVLFRVHYFDRPSLNLANNKFEEE